MKKNSLLRLSIFTFSLIISMASFASFDIFIQWQNGIKGDTQDEDFASQNASEVFSIAFGAENDINYDGGSVPSAGKARFEELAIRKGIDNASMALFQKCASGEVLKSDVIISFRTRGAEAAKSGYVFCTIRLKDVIVSHYSLSGSDGDDILEEEIRLVFGAVVVTYTPQLPDGTPDEKNKKTFRWSIIRGDSRVNE